MRQSILLVLLSVMVTQLCGQDTRIKKMTIAEVVELSAKYKLAGDIKESTRYLNEAAMRLWESKDYEKAISYFDESIELNKQIKNESGIAKIHSNLGMIYADLQAFERSLEYFQLSLDYRLENGERSEIISTYVNKSVVLNNLKKHTEAALNLEDALTLATEMSDAAQMKSCYGMLAETYEKAGNEERTIHYFNLYRTFHEMVQRNKMIESKKESETARLKAMEAELEKKQKELELLFATKKITEQDEKIKNNNSEIQSLLDNNTKQQLANSLLARKLELDQLRLNDSEARNKAQRIWIDTVLFTLMFIIVMGGLLYRQYRSKQKMNTLLAQQNDEIKTLNENLEVHVQARTVELQQTLLNLQKRNRELDQYSHVVSHNLRGPVANILGLGKIINRSNPSDPINIEIFDRLLVAANNMDTVVKDLSMILSVQHNQDIPQENVSLIQVINSVTKMLQSEIEKSKMQINTDMLTVKEVTCVKPYLESIIYNLVSNAIKYRSTTNNPMVRFESMIDSQNFILIVSDNGIGIRESDYDKIFEPYKRLTLNGEGKGLGLYLVKSQIESIGGNIRVASEEGIGTIFKIVIPVRRQN